MRLNSGSFSVEIHCFFLFAKKEKKIKVCTNALIIVRTCIRLLSRLFSAFFTSFSIFKSLLKTNKDERKKSLALSILFYQRKRKKIQKMERKRKFL